MNLIIKKELVNLTPHRSNWDIKRDLAPKLDKIELQTKKAIAMLLSMYYFYKLIS